MTKTSFRICGLMAVLCQLVAVGVLAGTVWGNLVIGYSITLCTVFLCLVRFSLC